MAKELGLKELYFKLEYCNPSGSYKDRFIALELALCHQRGVSQIFATSSGNTGAALAAYCARYALPCHIFVLEETPREKLVQMAVHGANLQRVRGFGNNPETTQAIFDTLEELQGATGGQMVVSSFRHSPQGMAGVKTISHEIADQLGHVPDHTFVPVGGGGLYCAVVKGYVDLVSENSGLPKVHVVQPETNNTVVGPLREGANRVQEVDTVTRISGLAVPVDIDGTRALELARRCRGEGFLTTDAEIVRTQHDLMRYEGLFAEPAGAASVAGLRRAVAEGRLSSEECVVCLLTGHGFKDSASLTQALEPVPLIDVSDIRTTLKPGA